MSDQDIAATSRDGELGGTEALVGNEDVDRRAHRTSIFLPFFTTKADGNGIGLAAARQIAQGHGGDVTLRAALPTTFDLSVPL